MSWTTPKTDWQVREYVNGLYSGDWFNLADYNRIRENLLFLRTYAQNALGVSIPLAAMPKRSFGGYPRAGDFNAIEENLLSIVNAANLLPPGYYSRTDWAANGAFLTFADLNRIEGAAAWLYAQIGSRAEREAFIPRGADGLTDADGEAYTVIEGGA